MTKDKSVHNAVRNRLPKDSAEIQTILEMVEEALKSGDVSKEMRIEVVMRMLIRRSKPRAIASVIMGAFKVSRRTVEEDIKAAKDMYVNWYNSQKENDLKAESAATMDEAMAMAFAKQDVQGIVQAQKHKDTLNRLVRDEDAPAAVLGVAFIPSRKDIKAWQAQFSKPVAKK